RWCPSTSPFRCQDCCLPVHAHRWLSAQFPGPILLSTIIHFSEFNDAACVLAFPLLRTPHLCDRPSVRLPTWWLACGRVGLDGFLCLTHWVTLMSFKGYHPYSLAPDFSRHEHVLVRLLLPSYELRASSWPRCRLSNLRSTSWHPSNSS